MQKNRIPENTVRFIESKLASIREDLSRSSEHLKSVRASDKIIDLSAQGNYSLKNILDIETKIAGLKRQLEVLQMFQNQLQRQNYNALISPSLSREWRILCLPIIQAMNQLSLERQKKA